MRRTAGIATTTRRCRAVLALMAIAAATPAAAQVYEVGDDGSLSVRSGAGAVSWSDARAAAVPTGATPARTALAAPVAVPAAAPAAFRPALAASSVRHGVDPALLEAVVWQESRWRAQAVSRRGAVGLTQLMPGTARDLGVADARDPAANLDGGARYLRQMLARFGGDLVKALAAYNAGPRRVERAGGVPPIAQTQNYVAAVLARLANQVPALGRTR
ncbi:MAG: lytic transglycosylase domain-containing protein [Sphingomonadaceae bacterium]|nr:lytic transglycosylase domain-containing protein [Sphingomonadaceae bacterium]